MSTSPQHATDAGAGRTCGGFEDVRRVLLSHARPPSPASQLIFQVSSMSATDVNWLTQIAEAFGGAAGTRKRGRSDGEAAEDEGGMCVVFFFFFTSSYFLRESFVRWGATSLTVPIHPRKHSTRLARLCLVWPTVAQVTQHDGATLIHGDPERLSRPELRPLLHRWVPLPRPQPGRERLPHTKIFARATATRATATRDPLAARVRASLDWVLVTSANLSQSALGRRATRPHAPLVARSFELGVLLVPDWRNGEEMVPLQGACSQGCNQGCSQGCNQGPGPEVQVGTLPPVVIDLDDDLDSHVAPGGSAARWEIPIPFEIPPQQYGDADVPFGRKESHW
jgi:hypothetical protein